MQSLFVPKLASGWLLKKLIDNSDLNDDNLPVEYRGLWTATTLKKCHFEMVYDWCWQIIRQRMLQVAHARIRSGAAFSSKYGLDVQNVVPVQKKQRTMSGLSAMDMLNALAGCTSQHDPATDVQPQEKSASSIADDEIEFYKTLEEKVVDREGLVAFWKKREHQQKMPCLSQVVAIFLSVKSSTGGLECDFVLMNDIISAKRASLGAG